MSGPNTRLQQVTVEVEMAEPELVAAAFDLIRTLAAAHDLPDIKGVQFNMTLTLEGWSYPSKVDAFRQRINQMWLDARVTEVQELETPPEGSAA